MIKEDEMKSNLPAQIKINNAKPLQRARTSVITPEELDKVRGRVLDTVKENLPNVRGVLNGKLKWTNQQVKLFQIMLNKVLPDLSASMNEHIHKNRTVDQLTRAELEAIVANAKKASQDEVEAEDVILDAEYDEGDDLPEVEVLEKFNSLQNEL